MTAPKTPIRYHIDYTAEPGLEITECGDCFGWFAEIVRGEIDQELVVRQWHSDGCATYLRIVEHHSGPLD